MMQGMSALVLLWAAARALKLITSTIIEVRFRLVNGIGHRKVEQDDYTQTAKGKGKTELGASLEHVLEVC